MDSEIYEISMHNGSYLDFTYLLVYSGNSALPLDKMAAFSQMIFSDMRNREWKVLYFG